MLRFHEVDCTQRAWFVFPPFFFLSYVYLKRLKVYMHWHVKPTKQYLFLKCFSCTIHPLPHTWAHGHLHNCLHLLCNFAVIDSFYLRPVISGQICFKHMIHIFAYCLVRSGVIGLIRASVLCMWWFANSPSVSGFPLGTPVFSLSPKICVWSCLLIMPCVGLAPWSGGLQPCVPSPLG